MEMEHLVKLIETVSHSSLSRFTYEESGVKIQMEKPEVVQAAATHPVSVETEIQAVQTEENHLITCPLVGIFYISSEEGGAPYVNVGDSVKKGQTLAIVEAMKLMNEIESECDGVVTEILAKNAEAVEFGQPLFRIRPDRKV